MGCSTLLVQGFSSLSGAAQMNLWRGLPNRVPFFGDTPEARLPDVYTAAAGTPQRESAGELAVIPGSVSNNAPSAPPAVAALIPTRAWDADGLPRYSLWRKDLRRPSSDRSLRTSSVCLRIPCLR